MKVITREEWEVFKDWQSKLEGSLQAFQVNFMTKEEINRLPLAEPAPLDDETEALLLDEMEAWHEMQKAELLALAEKLGCSIYLAGYLKYIDDKLECVAEAFGSKKVVMQEPQSVKAALQKLKTFCPDSKTDNS